MSLLNFLLVRRLSFRYNLPYASTTSIGEEIIRLSPQIICCGDATDVHGNPIALELYGFSPTALAAAVPMEDYKRFVVYSLQYKSIIIEQLSELKERNYLLSCGGNPPPSEHGYGVILQCTIIRCLKGLTMEFMGISLIEYTHCS